MLSMLAELLSALAVTGAFLNIIWLRRSYGSVSSPCGLFSIVTFGFAVWHFVAACIGHGEIGAQELVTSVFILLVVSMNLFTASFQQVQVGKLQTAVEEGTVGFDRRKHHNVVHMKKSGVRKR